MNIDKKENRIIYFDLLNIAACYGVIWLHCSGDPFTFRLDKYWLTSLFIQVIAHWAVPMFFMLTGANLINYREKYSTRIYFKRRLLRIFIPFLLWSTIYLVWKCRLGWIHFSGLRELLGLYLNNGIENIFWFFYPLFAIYLCMPILNIFADKKYKTMLLYMTGLGIIAYSFAPVISSLSGIPYSGDLNPSVINGYLIYVLLGWILKNQEFSRKNRCILYALGVLGAIAMFAGTIVLSIKDGSLNDILWQYMHFPTLFMTCAIFVFAKYFNWNIFLKSMALKTVITNLSKASFGVYLIHIMLIDFLTLNQYVNGDSRWWMLLGPVVIYTVTVLIVMLCKKIPGIKYLFP